MNDILTIVLCGYLADCAGLEQVHHYACDKHDVLGEFLDRPCGMPSHDTANRVFPRLNPAQGRPC